MRPAALLPAGLLLACSGSSGPGSLAGAIPADALASLTFDRLDVLRERAQGSVWAELFRDESFERLLALALPEDDAEAEYGRFRSWPHALGAVQGELVLFVTPPATPGVAPGVVLLVEPEEREDWFYDFLLERAGGYAIEDDLVKMHAGVELRFVPDGEATKVVFWTGGVVGLVSAPGARADTLACGVVDRLVGADDTPGLVATARYREARGDGPPPAFELHARLGALVGAFGIGAPGDDDLARRLGLDRIGYGHARGHLGAGEELGLSIAIELPRDTFLGRAADLLGPLPVDLLERLPAASVSVGLASFDVQGLLRDLPELREWAGSELAPVEPFLRTATGRFAMFAMPVPLEDHDLELVRRETGLDPDDLDPALLQGAAYVAELSDADALRRETVKLLNEHAEEDALATEEVAGTTILALRAGPITPRWAFAGDLGCFSLQPTPLRALARLAAEGGASAADDARFAAAAEAYGDASVLTVTPTAAVAAHLVATVRLMGALVGPAPAGAAADRAAFGERFPGTTALLVRREGDRLELALEVR